MRLELAPHEQRLVAQPFAPFDSAVGAMLRGQLTGSTNETEADCVLKWDPTLPGYERAIKVDHTGDPRRDGMWVASFSDPRPSPMTLEPGEGFYLWNRQAVTQSVFLAGEVVLEPSASVVLRPTLNLFAYPFSTAIGVEQTKLWPGGGATQSAETAWADEIVDVEALAGGANTLRLGAGYWYWRKRDTGLLWVEPRPYEAAVFPTDAAPPCVESLSVEAGTARLVVACTGASGERLDVYYQDLRPEQPFSPMRGWRPAQSDVAVAGRRALVWTDAGAPGRAPPWEVFGRCYLVGRSDVDADGDGMADVRDLFLGDSAGGNPADGEGRSAGGAATDAPRGEKQSGSPASNTVWTAQAPVPGAVVYVDRRAGCDLFSGRTAIRAAGDGPKRTIRGGLAAVRDGDRLVIRAGEYPEHLRLSGRRLAARVEGSVRLRGAPPLPAHLWLRGGATNPPLPVAWVTNAVVRAGP